MAAPLKVEFHFDFGSPNAYLAELALPTIEQRTGVKFDYVPVLLGVVYKGTGNLSATELRIVAQMARGIDAGPVASLFKIRGTEIFQNITELTHRAIGNYGLAIREHPPSDNHFMPGPDYGHTVSEKYLNSRKLSIYGGSNEIQRNIIPKAVLGLQAT